jgi:hypothetical protein
MSQTITQERRSALDDFGAAVSAGEMVPAAMQPHTLAILSRSEIDAQMASAGTRPRDLRLFRDNVQMIALMNEEAAADCHYALPARKDDGEPIEGPSIRFAEILAYAWGNCRVGARVIEEAMDHVTAQGIFSDVQTNGVSTFEVRRRITDRRGRRYSLDMVNVTANAACSIARRNAILQAIPKPLWWDLYQDARRMAAGSEAELGPRRDKAIGAFRDLGVDEKRIFAMLGVDRADQIGLDKLARLRGIYTAVKDGAVSIRDIASPPDSSQAAAGNTSALDAFAAGGVSSNPPAASTAADEGGGEGLQQASAAADDSGSPAKTTSAAGEGGDEPKPPATPSSPPQDPDKAVRRDAIAEALQIAGRADLEADDRLEKLDDLRMQLLDRLSAYPEFVKTLIETSAKVARKELAKATAQKYLALLKDG